MIWVLLQTESPCQRNNAITFFIYLCVSLYQEFFLRNRLNKFVPAIIASNSIFLLNGHVHIRLGNNASEKWGRSLVNKKYWGEIGYIWGPI